MSPLWWSLLPIVIITRGDVYSVSATTTNSSIHSSIQNPIVKRGGQVKVILHSIYPTSPLLLECKYNDLRGSYVIVMSRTGIAGVELTGIQPPNVAPLKLERKPEPTILIPNITFAQERANIQWSMFYRNDSGMFYSKSGKALMIQRVEEAPRIYGVKLPAIKDIKEDNELDLQCTFIGLPLEGKWDGKLGRLGALTYSERTEGDLKVKTIILTIKKVGYTYDKITGYCSANNAIGRVQQNTTLNVLYSPKETKFVTLTLNATEGQNITLHCSAKANPAAKYRIFHRQTKLVDSPTGHYVFLSKNCAAESGLYSCTAYNEHGDGTKVETNITISGPIRISTANVTTQEFENTTLSCTATACPSPHITWYRQGSSVPLHRGNNFALSRVTVDKAGIYHCVASNKDGNKTADVMLSVKYSPRQSKLVSVTQNPRENSNILLRCSTKAYPAPHTYLIYRGASLLQNSSKAEYTFLPTNCKNQSGFYSCSAINELGRDSANLTLNIYGPPKSIIPASFSEVFVNESSNITLTCMATGCPLPNITWYKEGNNMVMARTAKLALTFVKPNDSGRYICMASNGKESHNSSSLVNVRYSPRNLKIDSNMKDGQPEEGNELRVVCKADAYPKARYELYQDDKQIHSSQSGIFIVAKTQCNVHSGNYSCRAFNTQGSSGKQYLKINIDGSPKLKSSPQDHIVNETNTLQLSCNASGCPHPEVTWKKSDKVIGKGETLRLTNVKSNETGTYMCLASNRAGSINSTFKITVQYSPKIAVLIGPESAVAGSTVRFNCSAESIPLSKYRFYKGSAAANRIPVSSDNSEATGILIVKDVRYDTRYQTTYGCIPFNLLGDGPAKEKSIQIEVPPSNQTITPRGISLARKEGTPLNLTCSVDIANPQAKIVWLAQGNKVLSDSPVLRLSSLKREDSGLYTCNATNKHGALSKSIAVNVTYPPIVSSAIVKEFNNCIDSSITLECYGTGNPVPTASIIFSGGILASQWKRLRRTITVTNENYGTYECVVTNIHGSSKVSIKVQKQLYPGIPSNMAIKSSENNLIMTWSAPKCSGQAGVASYVIYYRGKNDIVEKREAVNCKDDPCEFTLRSLSEETTYQVAIVAVDKNGKEGSKQLLAGIKTKAVIAKEKPAKLSGTTAAFIGIGAVVVFLLAIALFVMVRRRSNSADVEDGASAPKRAEEGQQNESTLKFDNAAYDNAADAKDQSNGQANQSANETEMVAAADNPTCKVDEDEEAGNVPLEEEEEEDDVPKKEETKDEKEEKPEEPDNQSKKDAEKENPDHENTDNGKSVVIKKDNVYESVKADDV